MGSRSMRAGIIWLVLMGFAAVEGVETVIVLLERVGVVRLTAGRDERSAGLMSGILAMVVVGVLWVHSSVLCLHCDAMRNCARWAVVLQGSPATSRAGIIRTATRQTRS